MGEKAISTIVTIATAIVGVAIIAVLVGSKQTSTVIKAATGGFAKVIGVAVAPVSGSGVGSISTY